MTITPQETDLNILIVEDSRDDVELLMFRLRKSFKSVSYTHVSNLEQYIKAIRPAAASPVSPLASPPYNIVISDWAVPGYDGFVALKALQDVDDTIPFIVISGTIGEATAVALMKAGAYDFVLKDQSAHIPYVITKALEWADRRRLEHEQRRQIEMQIKALSSSPIAMAILDNKGKFEWINPAYEWLTGWTLAELKGHYLWEFTALTSQSNCLQIFEELEHKAAHQCEEMETRKDGSRYHEFKQLVKLLDTTTSSQRYLLIRQDITFLKEYRTRLEIDAELPQMLENCQTLPALYRQAAAYIRRTFDIEHLGFIQLDEQGRSVPPWYGDDMSQSPSLGIIQGSRFPIIVSGTTKALCVVEWKPSFMQGSDILLSYALEKLEQPLARLEAQENAREWMKRLSLLDVFKEYFGSGRNFGAAMSNVIRSIRETLGADSIALYLDNHDGMLSCREYDGFRTDLIKGAIIQPGQKNVGLAADERRIVAAEDLKQNSSYVPQFRELIAREQFVSQYCVPIILFNEVRAVLELFFRHPFKPDETWLAFAQAAAYQTGIALEFQSVIEELDGACQELQRTNESIIEGLSSALEFRDEETEGHTLRVTALFMSFASRFITNENELKRLRIGSLLHDIGKIGIPDAILNKPGPLTPEERAVMQKHPLISKEILSRIPSLSDCIDIPLYHHEKYDGTGYPFGLKGEEIPLAARIFAVIDVYEALTSNRPYRKAWSKEKAIEYIRDNAGTHFDPEIALRFMELNL